MFQFIAIAALSTLSPQTVDPTPVTKVTTDTEAGAEAPAKARPKSIQYCVKGDLTGSRIPRTVCQSRESWLTRGFDPLTAQR
jgi:hypothetical protein